jgi:hypothetical protein
MFLRGEALTGTTAPQSFVERGWQIWSSSRRPVSRLPSLQRRPSEDSPWEKRFHPTNFLGHNLRGAKSLESASNQSAHACGIDHRSPPHQSTSRFLQTVAHPRETNADPKICQEYLFEMFGTSRCPLPTPPPGWWFHRKCSESVREIFGTAGRPLPHTSPGWWFPRKCSENVRKIFGIGGCPLPHPSSGWWFPRKCSESVQKMLGTCRCPSTTPPPGWCLPLKCSENVRQFVRNC